MNSQEKALLRILFHNKIFKSEGQVFEDLFTEIMTYANSEFRKIKAWGNIGDRKNDGYVESKGIYYQVYAPEDIRKNYTQTIEKIETDFKGLHNQWQNIEEFYFVVNDKFKGINADSEQTLKSLKEQYNLIESSFFTSNNLENLLFKLNDDQIQKIVGFLPNYDFLNINYSILHEVVGYIMKLSLTPIEGEIKFPDWKEKILFNNLTEQASLLLDNSSQQLGALNKYLIQNSTLAEELQKQIIGVYDKIKNDWSEFDTIGDNIFWEIINVCSPKKEAPYQNAVITIMTKYFESCDIFEEPEKQRQL